MLGCDALIFRLLQRAQDSLHTGTLMCTERPTQQVVLRGLQGFGPKFTEGLVLEGISLLQVTTHVQRGAARWPRSGRGLPARRSSPTSLTLWAS